MTLKRWPAAALLLGLTVILGCSTASAAPPSLAPSPSEVRPTWTPVLDPNGYDGYVTDMCFDHSWVVLGWDDTRGGMSVAYGGRC